LSPVSTGESILILRGDRIETLNICSLLLAAGSGHRFGSDKLLAPLVNGVPVGLAAARNLASAGCKVLAVVRDPRSGIGPLLAAEGIELVTCVDAERGMGHSLACGVRAAHGADAWVVALADMPYLRPRTIGAVSQALAEGAEIVAPGYRGRRGHPVGFSSHYREELLRLTGDKGARALLVERADRICLLRVDDPGILSDIDRPGDLHR